ncbi:NECAP-like protein [Pseudocercospora fuligena]|uniref:NECAP-like protein n=1 Tax=Pseudocercospora fuligena TaxID=685502 RepID=A0A8H6VLF9_9PEZI|nr:NECAP-like protein [Pseudocercospora fuligena]
MTTVDPTTGHPLPDSAIQRILFITPTVHIYQIPPITSTSGFSASSWTNASRPTASQIFTSRLRILETSIDSKIKVDILLEDPSTGDLFAAAPYTSPAVIQQANDSSRFFAIRVVGERGMKATLGLGFEDRSPAFDFGIALGEARKVLGFDANGGVGSSREREERLRKKMEGDAKKDFSLKEGEKIHVNIGRRGQSKVEEMSAGQQQDNGAALFSIAPPPPPAAAAAGKVDAFAAPKQPSVADTHGKTAQELGFDDGEFGEFQ